MKVALCWTSGAVAASVALGFLSNLAPTSAHSWLECTDYRIAPGSTDARVWNPSLCQGRARCGRKQMDVNFGIDTGFNAHTSTKCQCERDDAENKGTRKAPVASYTPGQRVCLAYPPKNHVADKDCTNENIPDAGVRITRTASNPTTDDPSTFVKDYEQSNGKHVNGQVDYKGFQNCPNFCQDKEHALCTMCFDLENDIAPGEYTFKWIWSFNSVDDVYMSCWEATVGSSTSSGGDIGAAGNNGKDDKVGNDGENERSAGGSPSVTPSSTTTPTPIPIPTPEASSAPASSDEFDPDCEEELGMPEPPSSSSGGEVGAEEDCEEELDMAESSEGGDDCDDALEIPDTPEPPSNGENGEGNDDEVGGEGEYEPAGEQGTPEEGGGEDSDCSLGLPIAGKSENGHGHNSPQGQDPYPATPATDIGGEANDYTEGAGMGGGPSGSVKGSESEDGSDCQHALPIANTPEENPVPQHSDNGSAPQGLKAYYPETTTVNQIGAKVSGDTESKVTTDVVDLAMPNQGSLTLDEDVTSTLAPTPDPNASGDDENGDDEDCANANPLPYAYGSKDNDTDKKSPEPTTPTVGGDADGHDHQHRDQKSPDGDYPHAYSFNNGADYNGGVVHPDLSKQTP